MACYYPITAFRAPDGVVTFVERGKDLREISLPCGRCVGCRLERSRVWAMRCMHEAALHTYNCFVTLTYDDEHYPMHGSLNYRHWQLFAKRLRKSNGPFRFYMCGEYGEELGRPHYHAALFGVMFHDLIAHQRLRDGQFLYRSKKLEQMWGKGFCTVGSLTEQSAGYIARYVMKKQLGKAAESHYERVDVATGELVTLVPEFNRMSNRPGIGAGWLEKYHKEVRDWDRVVVNGKEVKPPRYYDKFMKEHFPDRWEEIEHQRKLKAQEVSHDNTEARLLVKEHVAKARLSFYKRNAI